MNHVPQFFPEITIHVPIGLLKTGSVLYFGMDIFISVVIHCPFIISSLIFLDSALGTPARDTRHRTF